MTDAGYFRPDYEFQSSPAPEGECNGSVAQPPHSTIGFQSSPAPEGECNLVVLGMRYGDMLVSILTRP